MHTPGPWRLDRYVDSGRDNPGSIIADNPHGEGPEEIASVDWIGGGFHAEQVANARLIAAAPALLEALVAALHDLETSAGLMACDNEEGHSLFQLNHPSTKQIIAAIAAARGEGVTA